MKNLQIILHVKFLLKFFDKTIKNEIFRNLLATVWPEPIWIKVNGWWQILPQHQSTYLRGPESASIEIPLQTSLHKIFKNCFLWSKSYFTTLTIFTKLIWIWKKGCQFMQILGVLDMYFDASVVFVTSHSLLFRLALAILWLWQSVLRVSVLTKECQWCFFD